MARCVAHERGEFSAGYDKNMFHHDEAIAYARNRSECNGLKYKLFNSRYDSPHNGGLALN